MQQLTCVEAGRLEWRDVPEPRIEGDGEALIRPLAVARCDIDRLLIGGSFPINTPFALGHECVGVVAALGDGVRGLSIGQRVVPSFQVSCGACGRCGAGLTGLCERLPVLSDYGMQPLSGVEYGGMLSDLVRVPYAEAMLRPISPASDPVELASASDNVLDGYRAVAPHLGARPGSDVLVVSHGAASIPLFAAQAAISLGAREVHFASGDVDSLLVAEKLGARSIQTDFSSRPKRTYPIVVDAGVSATGLAWALRATEPEGTCQSVGFYPGGPVLMPMGRMYTLGIRFYIGRCHSAAFLPEVIGLIEAEQLRPLAVPPRIVEWEEAIRAWPEPGIKLIVRRNA